MPDYAVLGTTIFVMALFALSLDLILGYAGVVTLGHTAFFGVGAYAAGMLSAHLGWNEPLSGLVFGAAAAALAGFASGWVLLRYHGLAFLMLTLATAILLQELANTLEDWTGGFDGLTGITIDPIFRRLRERPLGPPLLLVQPRYPLSLLPPLPPPGQLALRPFPRRDPREHATHERDRRPGPPAPRGRLHDLGRDGGTCRCDLRPAEPVRDPGRLELRALRDGPHRPHSGRCRAALWRARGGGRLRGPRGRAREAEPGVLGVRGGARAGADGALLPGRAARGARGGRGPGSGARGGRGHDTGARPRDRRTRAKLRCAPGHPRRQHEPRPRGEARPHRAERRRQDDPRQPRHRGAPAGRRTDPRGRRGRDRAPRACAGQEGARSDLPDYGTLPRADRTRERHPVGGGAARAGLAIPRARIRTSRRPSKRRWRTSRASVSRATR